MIVERYRNYFDDDKSHGGIGNALRQWLTQFWIPFYYQFLFSLLDLQHKDNPVNNT
jgi:hypothetical protein